jgi:antitoxin HicB
MIVGFCADRPFTLTPSKIAIKRVLARQLAEEMKLKKITKTEIATRMQTNRSQLDRLLDPEKTGVSIDTIQRAASVVGRQLRVELKVEFRRFWRVRSPVFSTMRDCALQIVSRNVTSKLTRCNRNTRM